MAHYDVECFDDLLNYHPVAENMQLISKLGLPVWDHGGVSLVVRLIQCIQVLTFLLKLSGVLNSQTPTD